jgi:DNA-binding XRE family transcriptional regulator|tara:strand:- start:1345 stop:1818 length:474 start_codon:yes stop_codon:yes gene_type:complete
MTDITDPFASMESDQDELPKSIGISKKAGRPPHKANEQTQQMVLTATGMGMDQETISKLLDIAPKTLRKFYRHELDTGAARANLTVAKTLFKMATSGKNVVASIYWTKTRGGWVETVKNIHEGLPDQIKVSFTLDPPVNQESQLIDVTPHKETENAD